MNQWSSGMNAQGDSNYILPCGAWTSAGSNLIVRMTMGEAVDYFKPADGYDLCGRCCGARAVCRGTWTRVCLPLPAARRLRRHAQCPRPPLVGAQRAGRRVHHAELLLLSLGRLRALLPAHGGSLRPAQPLVVLGRQRRHAWRLLPLDADGHGCRRLVPCLRPRGGVCFSGFRITDGASNRSSDRCAIVEPER